MSSEHILFTFRDGVRTITFNRPAKKNAISIDMYERLLKVLDEDAKNDAIVVTIITGTGDFYSSGNDLNNAAAGERGLTLVRGLVQAFIDYPKLIIAVINGPAIGIAATTAALCDIVYASDTAYFDTPFLRIGLSIEGASSYTYPRILGRSKASELLYLGKKLSSQEAYSFGLISAVIPAEEIKDFIEGLYRYGSLNVDAVKLNKELVMQHLRNVLNKANDIESEGLITSVARSIGPIFAVGGQMKSKL